MPRSTIGEPIDNPIKETGRLRTWCRDLREIKNVVEVARRWMDSVVFSFFCIFFWFACFASGFSYRFVPLCGEPEIGTGIRERWDDHGDGYGRRLYPFRVPGDSGRMCTGTDRHRMTDQEADQGVVTDRSND